MQKINDILNWHFNPNDFKYSAEHFIELKTQNQIIENISSLNQLSDRLPDASTKPEQKLIRDVYLLFQQNHDNISNLKSVFSKREVRCLIWALDYNYQANSNVILFSNELIIAISLIESYWKDSFIIAFWHLVLKNWRKLHLYPEQQKFVFNLLSLKAKNYTKNRKDISKIASNIELFVSTESPILYAKKLRQENIYLGDCHMLLNQREQILTYSYFEQVAFHYLDKIENERYDGGFITSIYDFLQKQNKKETALKICSKIINDEIFNWNLEIIKTRTISLIDDPIKEFQWKHSNLNVSEQQDVEKARRKLNVLLNKHFIETFFEKLVDDKRRKNYWLKFIDKIDDIKFIGNKAKHSYLKNIQDISQFVDHRYKITKRRQNTSALVIYSKGFVFVEFTDVGALYIYKKNSFRVNLNAINGMEDLKIWSRYDYACKNSDVSGYVDLWEEGRIRHGGHWEDRVNSWMRRYYHD